VDLDGALERLRGVTGEQVRAVARRLAASPRATIVVGPDGGDRHVA